MKRIVSFLVTVALLLTLCPVAMPSVSATTPKLIAFTFDDGPSPFTAELLDGLSQRGAKATFFITGVNGNYSGAVYHKGLLKRMVSEGHQVANHTNRHRVPFDGLSAASIQEEVGAVNAHLFEAAGGTYQPLMRTPGGALSARIRENVHAPIILWDVDTLDWKYRNANTVCNNILNLSRDGSIVLLHDIHQTSIHGALAAMDILRQRGYECVTVSELFRRRGITLQNGGVYYSAYPNGTTRGAYQAPTVSMSVGTVVGKSRVTMSAASGLTIRYTTDGTVPTLASKAYTSPSEFTVGTTLTVAAFDAYGTRTPIVTKTVENPYEGVFDATYYANRYPDLKKAYGTDAAALKNHFFNHGLQEGRQASPLFSITYYMSQHPSLAAVCFTRMAYVQHFLSVGMANGIRASKQFDPVSYRLQYPDLRKAYGNNWRSYYIHYLYCGMREGRVAVGCAKMKGYATVYNGVNYAAVYNYNTYTGLYTDVRKAYRYDDAAVLQHFVTHGMAEGRRGCQSFCVQTYRARYADLRATFGSDLKAYYLHYMQHGIKEGRKGI